jgi:hypothetical protein
MWAPESLPSGETAISATQGATIAPSSRKRAEPVSTVTAAASRIASTISAVPAASAPQVRQ